MARSRDVSRSSVSEGRVCIWLALGVSERGPTAASRGNPARRSGARPGRVLDGGAGGGAQARPRMRRHAGGLEGARWGGLGASYSDLSLLPIQAVVPAAAQRLTGGGGAPRAGDNTSV